MTFSDDWRAQKSARRHAPQNFHHQQRRNFDQNIHPMASDNENLYKYLKPIKKQIKSHKKATNQHMKRRKQQTNFRPSHLHDIYSMSNSNPEYRPVPNIRGEQKTVDLSLPPPSRFDYESYDEPPMMGNQGFREISRNELPPHIQPGHFQGPQIQEPHVQPPGHYLGRQIQEPHVQPGHYLGPQIQEPHVPPPSPYLDQNISGPDTPPPSPYLDQDIPQPTYREPEELQPPRLQLPQAQPNHFEVPTFDKSPFPVREFMPYNPSRRNRYPSYPGRLPNHFSPPKQGKMNGYPRKEALSPQQKMANSKLSDMEVGSKYDSGSLSASDHSAGLAAKKPFNNPHKHLFKDFYDVTALPETDTVY